MKFQVLVLGTNAALPHKGKITSAQVLNANENLYLLDCGEGTQMKIEQYKVKRNRIKAVFITHLHGDHCFGLPGLLTSLSHHHRKEVLSIFGPPGIRRFVEVVLECSHAFLGYSLHITEVDPSQYLQIYEDRQIIVNTIPLKHRVPTTGYLIRQQKPALNIDPEAIRQYKLNIEQIKQVKSGRDIETNEGVIPNHMLTKIPKRPRSYAYCTDTIYDESIIPMIKGVDLLYHESTYLDDLTFEATARMHSTITQAAAIASAAGVGRLMTGHFSGRYHNTDIFVKAGSVVFPYVIDAIEGLTVDI